MKPDRARVLSEGLITGLLGYVVIVLFYGILNVFTGQSVFSTAAHLGAGLVSPGKDAYRVELGAALLCYASRSADSPAGAEGRRLLSAVEAQSGTADSPLRARAAGLLAEPDHACDDSEHYGRLSWH